MGESADERMLVEQCRQGSHDAFTALVQRHQRMIHAITFRMTGSWGDAEDLAQEAFITAFQRLNTFRGDAAFSSWLTRIAINACLNWRAGRARRERAQEEFGRLDTATAAPDDALPAAVQAALMKLPPAQRAAIVLTVYQGHNHAAAARLLGCAEATVSWRVFAARAKLKRLLRHWQRPS